MTTEQLLIGLSVFTGAIALAMVFRWFSRLNLEPLGNIVVALVMIGALAVGGYKWLEQFSFTMQRVAAPQMALSTAMILTVIAWWISGAVDAFATIAFGEAIEIQLGSFAVGAVSFAIASAVLIAPSQREELQDILLLGILGAYSVQHLKLAFQINGWSRIATRLGNIAEKADPFVKFLIKTAKGGTGRVLTINIIQFTLIAIYENAIGHATIAPAVIFLLIWLASIIGNAIPPMLGVTPLSKKDARQTLGL